MFDIAGLVVFGSPLVRIGSTLEPLLVFWQGEEIDKLRAFFHLEGSCQDNVFGRRLEEGVLEQ